MADGLTRDFSSIVNTTVVVGVASSAGAIRLTVLARWAHGVRVARTCADTGRGIANGLSRVFSSINVTISIGVASNANSAVHAVVTLSSNTISIRQASINTKTRSEITVRLERSFSSIKVTTGGNGSTANTVLGSLTIVTSRVRGGQAIVVRVATEWGNANTKNGIASGLVGSGASIEITTASIACAS